MAIISLSYLLLLTMGMLLFFKYKPHYRYLKIVLLLLVGALSTLAFIKTPPIKWDLQYQFWALDRIRKSDLGFFELVFNDTQGIGREEYRLLYFYNAIRYIITRVSANNHLLPLICVAIDYSIVCFILYDFGKRKRFNYGKVLTSFMCCMVFMPYNYAVSGIRNALASSIVALAVYLFFYNRIRIPTLFFLFACALTTHPSVICILPFLFLANKKPRRGGVLLTIMIPVFLNGLMMIISLIRIPIIELIVSKYYVYSSPEQYRSGLFFIAGNLFFIVLYLHNYNKLNSGVEEDFRIQNCLSWYMIFILGNVLNYDLFLRPGYTLGPLAPILIYTIVAEKSNRIENRTKMTSMRLSDVYCLLMLAVSFVVFYKYFVSFFPIS